MSEISLYRKYRPQNFQNLVGQDHVRTTLLNAAKRNSLSHAYLFCGPRGTGKTSTARLVAKLLNCIDIQEDHEPCNKCEICLEIAEGRLIDIIEIDAASNRGIDEMRELKDRIDFAPTKAKVKAYIIDEVHMLTKEAFNALLKTLEEPPEHAYFILATTEVYKIPETIISRCQRFDFKRITEKTIMTRLNYIAQLEKIEVEEGSIELIAHYVDGGMRDAIGLLEQLSNDGKLAYEHVCKVLGMSDHESIERMYKAIMGNDTSSALKEAHNVHVQGHDMTQFLKSFLEYVRQNMLSALSKKHEAREAARFLGIIDAFQNAVNQVRLTVIPQLPLEVAIVSVCENDVTEALNKESIEAKKKPHVKESKGEKEVKKEEDLKGLKEIPLEDAKEDIKEDENISLTAEEIQKKLPRVSEHILTPAVKRSFLSGKFDKLEGKNVSFIFSTQFHMDKVLENDNCAEIEKAFKAVFNSTIKLRASLKKVDLEPAAYEKQEAGSGALNETDESQGANADQDITDIAVDMFGGELIEE